MHTEHLDYLQISLFCFKSMMLVYWMFGTFSSTFTFLKMCLNCQTHVPELHRIWIMRHHYELPSKPGQFLYVKLFGRDLGSVFFCVEQNRFCRNQQADFCIFICFLLTSFYYQFVPCFSQLLLNIKEHKWYKFLMGHKSKIKHN